MISISPQTLITKDLYSSQNAITAAYYDKGTLYIGEYNYKQQKAYLTVNNKTIETNDLINIIYPMQDKFYTASFKSVHNSNTESYSEIFSTQGNIKTKLAEKGRITLYK